MFTINELSNFTGLTTRTIRNYIPMGLIHGQKIDGKWQFDETELDRILTDPYIRTSIQSKKKGLVEDFLIQDHKQANEMCVILDSMQTVEERDAVIQFLNTYLSHPECKITLSFEQTGEHARLILTGPETAVLDFLMEYRKR